MTRPVHEERGVVLVMFAISLLVLMAFAAMAVDIGMLFVERREDQAAADTGVLGGALDLPLGIDGAAEQAASIVRENLDTVYSDAEWAALWAACTDTGSLAFTGTVLGQATSCISFDGLGTLRVVVPDQEVETVFAGVLGIDFFNVSATAEASLQVDGVEGVLPFAVLGSATSGSELCLRSSSGGTAIPPCTGADSGNFGGLEVPQWGNPAVGTDGLPCNLNKSDQLMVNISVGIDHFLRPWNGTDVVDSCAKPYGPNMLDSFQGISGGLFDGMISGHVVSGTGFAGRLTRGSTARLGLEHGDSTYFVDNVPLWEYIPNGKGETVPALCTRESFESTKLSFGYAAAEVQMAACLTTYAAGSGFADLFDIDADADNDNVYDIVESPSYGVVPQFFELTFPSGGSAPLHLAGFRAVFINGLYFGCSGSSCSTVITPGSATGTVSLANGSSPLDQTTGYLLPGESVPDVLIANGVDGSLGPYQVRLTY